MPTGDTPTARLGQIATLGVRNEGGGLYGPAGTGKTLAIQRINEIWRRERPGDTIVNTAPTHVAAKAHAQRPDARARPRPSLIQI